VKGLAAVWNGRRANPPRRNSAYCAQLIALPKLAVADHVDADVGLLAHDLGDGVAQAFRVAVGVEGLAGLLRAEKLAQRRRTDEAADVGGENTIRAALHAVLPGFFRSVARAGLC
jgi:hypothetical protein